MRDTDLWDWDSHTPEENEEYSGLLEEIIADVEQSDLTDEEFEQLELEFGDTEEDYGM